MGDASTRKDHWEGVYDEKAAPERSWFQGRPDASLRLASQANVAPSARVIDVGGGTARFADELVARGFADVTVLDISRRALDEARDRLAQAAAQVSFVEADITAGGLPGPYELWHDRAVFHFLTEEADRRRYARGLGEALSPGGHLIIATFAEDGPSMCSGLPVRRYSADQLQAELGAEYSLVTTEREHHETPAGKPQSFVYCLFRRAA